jgi:hypothetical protein
MKAQARYQRWVEEVQMVKNEMFWTTLWFKTQEMNWSRRYEDASEGGQKAYAAKQEDVWRKFACNATEQFQKYMNAEKVPSG